MTEKYFAAANSADGFVSWFDEIFSPSSLDRCCILKGGSGTGKSTFMKRVATVGCAQGARCEYFYCSADPSSIDGILLYMPDGRTLGLLDGTSPHTRDPKYPGAVEELIDLGQCWSTAQLVEQRGEILRLGKEKSEGFSDAYRRLHAAGELSRLLRAETSRCILHDKLNAAARRLLTQAMREVGIKRGNGRPIRLRAVSALSTDGAAHFDTYSKLGKRHYAVNDLMWSAYSFFDALLEAGGELGLEMQRAPIPLEPSLTEAIYFPELELSVVTDTGGLEEGVRLVNMSRFFDRDTLRECDRRRLRSLARMVRELTDDALSSLSRARALHLQLEQLYIAAMDFSRADLLLEQLIERLFVKKM